MEGLPTEILLNIFGHIDDAVTLLDSVGVVCKRWNALVKDPRSWTGARISCHERNARVNEIVARVLRHAPALRGVTFSCEKYSKASEEARVAGPSFTAALSQCRASMREVTLYSMPSSSVRAVVALLDRQHITVRTLTVKLCGSGALQAEIFSCLERLDQLEELALDTQGRPWFGPLCLPSLRRLKYTVRYGVKKVPADHGPLLSNLLNGAAGSLRCVVIDVVLSEDAVLALSKCHGLTSLSVNVGAAAALRGMAGLRELRLWLTSDADPCPNDAAMPAIGSLPALRKLTFWKTVKEKPNCDALLVALGRAAPGITALSVGYSAFTQAAVLEDAVGELLGSLRGLTSVTLSSGGASLIPRLLALKSLKDINAELRVPSTEWEDCCTMLEQLQRTRPSLRGNVKLHPIAIKPRTFKY